MTEREPIHDEYRRQFAEQIARKQARRAKGRRQRKHVAWYGLGIFGVVGWSVVIPFLICLAIGIYIDATWPGRISWTLMLLVLGAALGALNGWYWVTRERKTIERESEHE
jgi:ATP synthase protein I